MPTPAQIRRALQNTTEPVVNKSVQVKKAIENSGGYYIGLDREKKTPTDEVGADEAILTHSGGRSNYATNT